MNAKKVRNYRSKNTGKAVFVYEVTGTAPEMEAFKTAQGEYYREDDKSGKALWFSVNFIGENGKLIITSTGKITADMSKFDEAQSIVEQYGGNFGNVLAQSIVAGLTGSAPQPAPAPVAETPQQVDAPAESNKDVDEM